MANMYVAIILSLSLSVEHYRIHFSKNNCLSTCIKIIICVAISFQFVANIMGEFYHYTVPNYFNLEIGQGGGSMEPSLC